MTQPHSDAITERLKQMMDEIAVMITDVTVFFETEADIDNLTYEQAFEVFRSARRKLLFDVLSQEVHEHPVDSCGDYAYAAVTNWNHLFVELWGNDFDESHTIKTVQAFLLMKDGMQLLGCDGDIRFDLMSDELRERVDEESYRYQ